MPSVEKNKRTTILYEIFIEHFFSQYVKKYVD